MENVFQRKRADLFHHRYGVLDELADSSKVPTKVLHVLGQPAMFSVVQSHTMFDPVMSTFSGQKALMEDRTRKLRGRTMNHCMEGLDK